MCFFTVWKIDFLESCLERRISQICSWKDGFTSHGWKHQSQNFNWKNGFMLEKMDPGVKAGKVDFYECQVCLIQEVMWTSR